MLEAKMEQTGWWVHNYLVNKNLGNSRGFLIIVHEDILGYGRKVAYYVIRVRPFYGC